MSTDTDVWWKHGVIYQIYPRSFQDTNSDGIGDLRGIRARLDYLQSLGIDAIWISPIYPSPMADFGYDISDYCGIAPMYGSLADFDALVVDVHRRGMRIILDFVPNHTSDQHPWFAESRLSRTNPKRDWYIWHDPAPDGGPPNNWMSNFGGSAWTRDETTGQYFYHAFLREQPDLNWRNPAVRAAMADVLRFWLDRGVDGFRVDVIWHLIKDACFQNNPDNPGYAAGQPDIAKYLQVHSADQPEIHDVIHELRSVVDSYPDRVLIGEIYLPLERLVTYYGSDLSGVHLPFNFQLLQATWKAEPIAKLIDDYEAALPPGGWPNWVLGNHDQPRMAHRVGAQQARIAAMLLLTLRGTPTMYYGDEIGMTNVPIPADRVQDPWERNEPGHGFGRDPERTPMQWSTTANAGFTDATPWLPVAADFATDNVETLSGDKQSILTLYKALLASRETYAALSVGAFVRGSVEGDILWYSRTHDATKLIVMLNFGSAPATITSEAFAGAQNLVSTYLDRGEEIMSPTVSLRSGEGLILLAKPDSAVSTLALFKKSLEV